MDNLSFRSVLAPKFSFHYNPGAKKIDVIRFFLLKEDKNDKNQNVGCLTSNLSLQVNMIHFLRHVKDYIDFNRRMIVLTKKLC